MSPGLLALALLSAAPRPSTEALARRIVAETAIAQVKRMDPAWDAAQRDCAGLVRHAYRAAFRRLDPQRVARGIWLDDAGRPTAFADAETLLARSFAPLGRGEPARRQIRSGDLLAFRQAGADGGPVYHLMLVVLPTDRAQAPARVVYHPGEKGAAVRTGLLDELSRDAPSEWRPVESNGSFLGFYRFKEWTP